MTAPNTTNAPAATKPGVKTSEFWLSMAAMGVVVAGPAIDNAVQGASNSLASHSWWGPLAAAAIASVYTVGRSMVKAKVGAPN